MNYTQYVDNFSTRAHHTGELLPPIIIWWTGQPSTNGFHMVEESLIGISTIKSSNRFGIFVHTFICGSMMTMVFSHQVSSVLCGPVHGAIDFSWNHQQCSPCDLFLHLSHPYLSVPPLGGHLFDYLLYHAVIGQHARNLNVHRQCNRVPDLHSGQMKQK